VDASSSHEFDRSHCFPRDAVAVYDLIVLERFRRWLRSGSAGWQLVSDGVFAYRAPNGFDGVCHLRVFDPGARGKRPVVIAGQLSDQGGACSIVNADEWIAAQVQDAFFPDGREFVYVEHHPQTVAGQPEPTFDLVKLERRRTPGKGSLAEDVSAGAPVEQQIVVVTEEGAESRPVPAPPAMPEWGWEFRALRRPPLAVHRVDGSHVEVDLLPGVKLRVWPAEDYTAYAVAGEEGALPAVDAAQANSGRAAELTEAVEGVTDAPSDAILDVQPDPPEEDPPDPPII
jgi:hypothetical protein